MGFPQLCFYLLFIFLSFSEPLELVDAFLDLEFLSHHFFKLCSCLILYPSSFQCSSFTCYRLLFYFSCLFLFKFGCFLSLKLQLHVFSVGLVWTIFSPGLFSLSLDWYYDCIIPLSWKSFSLVSYFFGHCKISSLVLNLGIFKT